jgi:hypothetical protein
MKMRNLFIGSAVALLATGCSSGGGSGDDITPPAPVASIVVEPDDVTLNRGESMQLNATMRDVNGRILQGRSVTWSSDDTSKVTVTSLGVVEAHSAGNAKITVNAEGKNATAQVLVVEPPGSVSRVELNTASELLEEGASFQLEATAYDASDNILTGRGVSWTSYEPGIASVAPGGLVTALRPGLVEVTAVIEGKQASATIRIFADYPFELIYEKTDVGVPNELFTLDISDPAGVALPVFAPGATASHASPSPDGNRIAFVVHGQWDGTFWQSMIFVADRSGGNARRLTYLPARNLEPAWSPDGSRIAFSSQPSDEDADIWIMNVDGSGLVNLTADHPAANERSPAWSPQLAGGTYRIAYSLESGGASSLWTMRPDGSDKLQITWNPDLYDSEPAWSPDGLTLVFQRVGTAIFGDLYLVSSTGGEARALMPANPLAFGQFGPTWSPDGHLIAFTSKHGDGELYQVWTVWADGSRLAQRTQDLQQHLHPAWIRRP